MIVDYSYYAETYMGTEADNASFPALCARAEDVIGAMTHWRVTDETITDYPALVQTLIKKAICAQIDFFAVNGLDSVAGGNDRGFTVGKVSISGKSGSDLVRRGAMAENISPMVMLYLEQSGLLNPQAETAPDMPYVGRWPLC